MIAAFVVFAGTNSRGDLLTRGWGRVVGTIGGVIAGMGLAALVGDNQVLSLVLLFAGVFLALYLVRISPAMLAFWITAVLALVYGLIGQFSVEALLLRIEETAIGAAASRDRRLPRPAAGDAGGLRGGGERAVDAIDQVLADATERLVGRAAATSRREGVRAMDDALATLRARTVPLTGPFRRATDGYRDTLHVLAGVDHYARALARISDDVRAPDWAAVLQPAVDRVRSNLDGLCDGPTAARPVCSAEELVDAAEAWAARRADHDRRHALLEVARLVRRIDQSVLTLAGASAVDPAPGLSRR